MIDDRYTAGSVSQDVVLSEQERAALAELAAGLDDTWLSSQLLGIVPPPPRRQFHIPSCWVGILLTMLGATLALAAFTQGLWGVLFGVGVMASGVALVVVPRFRVNRVSPMVRAASQRGQWAPRSQWSPRSWRSPSA
ncbi:MAG: hypothetical protein ACRD0O_18480 [Acidimicrobiia bacterium]